MSYRPDEKDWMAYLYGELEGAEKDRFDQYLLENPEAQVELEKYHGLRKILSSVDDKEVIAPPIVVSESKQRFIWDAPYFRTIIGIAASLLLIILAGKLTGTEFSLNGNEFRLTFGGAKPQPPQSIEKDKQQLLTPEQVQDMINESLEKNNTLIAETWKENEQKLTASIRSNLAVNSNKIDQLMRQASTASQEQIGSYVANLQSQNMQLVKDYFALSATEQKTYIENLLVDFADYLQQQRTNDMQVVQLRLNSLEQNTDLFKQETEQILTSIITSVGAGETKETRN
jgi:hypothetical protein